MVGVVAKIRVKPGQEAAFEAAIRELIAAVQAEEPDTLVYQCFKDRSAPQHYVMLEVYRDQSALDQHQKTAHFQAIGARLMPTFDGMPTLELFDPL